MELVVTRINSWVSHSVTSPRAKIRFLPKLALITPKIVDHPESGFELRLKQLQAVLRNIAAEEVAFFNLDDKSIDSRSSSSLNLVRSSPFKRGFSFFGDLVALGFHIWPKFLIRSIGEKKRDAILQWIDREQIDIAIIVHPYITDLIPDLRRRGIHVFVDCQNVESDSVYNMIDLADSGTKIVKMLLRWITYRRWEQRLFPIADEVWLPSEIDCSKQRMICSSRIKARCIPNALDIRSYNPCRVSNSSDIVFSGSFSYSPNVEGAKALRDKVLPEVRRTVPGVRLMLVGQDRDGKASLLRKHDEVIVTGVVADTKPYLCRAGVVAVPILHGSGTRFKILEALALGLPVVTTPLGCQGLAVEDSQHLLIRPVDHFAEAIIYLLKNPERATDLGRNGRKLIEAKYTWNGVESQLRAALNLANIPS